MLLRRRVVRIRPTWRCHLWPTAQRSYSSVPLDVQSSTAVHTSPLESSPKRLALYNTLHKLQSVSHAELAGRFNLALEDLKEWEAPFRIAILGTGIASRPGRLIRLLASPKKDDSEWAQKLSGTVQPGHGIIITPGEDATFKQSSLTPMAEITLPHATKLLSPRFTMVILNLDPSRGPFAALEPSIPLGPRKGNLYYPVHRSIMVVENLQGLLDSSATALLQSLNQDLRVIVTVDSQTVRAAGNALEANTKQRIVSLDLAEAAISTEQKDAQAWSESRIEDAIPFLSPGKADGSNETDTLSEHVHTHIQSLLDTALEPLPPNPQNTVTESVQQASGLGTALSAWSKEANDELQNDLNPASISKTEISDKLNTYEPLRWWNLPWKARRVNEICTTVIKNDFLVNAERLSYWFGGRLVGEGFKVSPLAPSDFTLLRDAKASSYGFTQSPITQLAALLPPGVVKGTPFVYPYHIPLGKSHIVSNLNPLLQAEAKQLRLSFTTNVLLSSAMGILLELSQFSTYASLSVFSLGFVFAARRLQVNWDAAQKKWEDAVREVGRVSILDVQHWVSKILQGEKTPNFEEAEKWKAAVKKREEVLELRKQAKALLEELQSKRTSD